MRDKLPLNLLIIDKIFKKLIYSRVVQYTTKVTYNMLSM